MSACLALLLGIVTARKEILKRQGDYYLRLHNQGGNLVLDEGDVIQRETPLKAPNMYIRKKRIAHARDFQKFLKVKDRNIGRLVLE